MDISALASSAPATPPLRDAAPGEQALAINSSTRDAARDATQEAAPAQLPMPPRESLDAAVASISSFVQSVQRNLDFSIDDSSGTVVIKVTDRDSGELIRQLPSEEALRLSEKLEGLRGLIFETRA